MEEPDDTDTPTEPDQRYSNRGAALLEGLEAKFSASIEDIAVEYRDEIKRQSLPLWADPLDEFLSEYRSQVSSEIFSSAPPPFQFGRFPNADRHLNPSQILRKSLRDPRDWRGRSISEVKPHIAEMPVQEVGDTRPVALLRRGDIDPWGREDPRMDAKNLMLYSTQTVLLDPLVSAVIEEPAGHTKMSARWRAEHRNHFMYEGLDRTEWLARSLDIYADLAPAFRANLIDVQPVDYPEAGSLGTVVGEEHTLLWEIDTGLKRDPNLINPIVADVLLRIQAALLAPGLVHPLARPKFEETLVNYYYKILYRSARRQKTPESLRTTARLLMLNLPGVRRARTTDLVDIRDDQVFSEVRDGVRQAVANAAGEANYDDARLVAEQTFKALVRPKRTFTKALAGTLVPQLLQYGVGAAIAVEGRYWQAALPIAVGTTAEAAVNSHESRARKAQRSLYVALSRGA